MSEGEVGFIEMTKSCARDLTDRIKAAGEEFAVMLYNAHEGRAWAALGYKSWTEYCKAEFQMSRPRSYQLLDFVEIKREIEVSTLVDSPQNERQTRALKSVPAEKRAEVWEAAKESAGGEQPKAKEIEAAALEVMEPEHNEVDDAPLPSNLTIPKKRESRTARWNRAASDAETALSELHEIQQEYQDWYENLPENLRDGAVGEKLAAITELDIESALSTVQEAAGADLPLGFGRD